MKNPLDALKRLWADKKKRPWLLAGLGAAGAAGVLTMRSPQGPDAAAEETAATDAAAPLPADVPQAAYAEDVVPSGAGMYGTYVGSTGYDPGYYEPPDYEPGVEEMDFTPLFEAMAEQGASLEEGMATMVEAEREEREAAVAGAGSAAAAAAAKADKLKKKLKRQQALNARQDKRLDRQKKTLTSQRKALKKIRQRVRKGPTKKPRKQPGRKNTGVKAINPPPGSKARLIPVVIPPRGK